MGLFGKIFGPKKEPTFAEQLQQRVAHSTKGLRQDALEWAFRALAAAGSNENMGNIADCAVQIMTGQRSPEIFGKATAQQRKIAEQIAEEYPRANEEVRIRAAHLCLCLVTMYQEIAEREPTQREEALKASIDIALRPLHYKPDYGEFLALAAKSYGLLGEKEQAFDMAERAVTMSPDDMNAHFTLGLIAYELERFDVAKASLERALQLEPRLQGVHEMIATMPSAVPKDEPKSAAFQEAVSKDPLDRIRDLDLSSPTLQSYALALQMQTYNIVANVLCGVQQIPEYSAPTEYQALRLTDNKHRVERIVAFVAAILAKNTFIVSPDLFDEASLDFAQELVSAIYPAATDSKVRGSFSQVESMINRATTDSAPVNLARELTEITDSLVGIEPQENSDERCAKVALALSLWKNGVGPMMSLLGAGAERNS